ncbi:flagellar protein FlaG [Colwellia echini]|uniref:Flagellar protein FlaG n=1 Tax=Colwellia echini TaxID=1982103 RepID=A0ABY3MX33_9GAMM|nr:flagellar protein FlaG [Colwellia echini]TYK65587.1 flagellar protein FlaG [Colwellia echini]
MSVELNATTGDVSSANPVQVPRGGQKTVDTIDVAPSLAGNNTTEEDNLLNQINEKATKDKKNELMSPTQLENVAKQLQEFIGTMNRGLEFIVDDDSGRDVIKVIDKNSGDVIKQYPTEEVLSLVAKLSEATGNFVDSKV